MKASFNDFRLLAVLIGVKHWTNDDWADQLSVERAEYWLPLVTKLHVPQQALLRSLEGQLFYYKDDEGRGWKELVSTLLNKRALVLLRLMHAVDNKEPVRW